MVWAEKKASQENTLNRVNGCNMGRRWELEEPLYTIIKSTLCSTWVYLVR